MFYDDCIGLQNETIHGEGFSTDEPGTPDTLVRPGIMETQEVP